MAGSTTEGVPTSTGVSTLASNGLGPPHGGNPGDNPSPPGGSGGSPIGQGGGNTSASKNDQFPASPTETLSQNDSHPSPSSTSSISALPSPSIITFNDNANFGNNSDNTGRVFFTSKPTKLFSWTHDDTTTLIDIFWYGRIATDEAFNVSQATVIASANFGGSRPSEFAELNSTSTTLNLTATGLSNWYRKEMVIKIDWETKNQEKGFSQSGVFTVAVPDTIDPKAFGGEATGHEQDKQGGEAVTSGGSIGNPTLPTGGGSGNGNGIGGAVGGGDGHSGGGHSGLSTGAIVGIAVASSIVGIALLGALAWFFIRRHRRRHLDEGYKATRQTTSSFIAAKEVQPSVAESPIVSPFSDDGEVRAAGGPPSSAISMPLPLETSATRGIPAGPASTHDDDRTDRPDAAASGNNNMGRNIAHLVEEGMTEADILRLEEEERHLDAEIERAARRGD
ncbi:hypothetical protein Trco_005546 [Trichoderma cornu-damae]|uniref:Uncharacterized protein n=1 Tax=Trichoderma cornu-damae TaxID=654480 RepID=A0A9P8QNN5_9HYPO|nr:hypothetical protein Trco_005546 [Trichoderma cornu-damae]